MFIELINQLLAMFGLDHLWDLIKAVVNGDNVMDVLK